MSDLSFMSFLETTVAFLTTTFTAPAWLFLLLFIMSAPQFIKIYRSFKNTDKTVRVTKNSQPPAKKISNNTDNKFTESMISTVQKLKSIPNEAFTESVITTVKKFKNVAHSASEAASDGIAAAAKKFETEMESKNVKPEIKNEDKSKEQIKQIILQKLFYVGDNGRLPQSIASDLEMSSIVTNGYLDELTKTKLIAKRKTTLGDTYFVTKLGVAFCEQQGFDK